MSTKKANNISRLAEQDAQKRAADRLTQRNKRWQRIAFVAVSLIVLLSMILTLFIQQ